MGPADRSSVCDGHHSMAQRLPKLILPTDLVLVISSLGLHLILPSPSQPTSLSMGKDAEAASSNALLHPPQWHLLL